MIQLILSFVLGIFGLFGSTSTTPVSQGELARTDRSQMAYYLDHCVQGVQAYQP